MLIFRFSKIHGHTKQTHTHTLTHTHTQENTSLLSQALAALTRLLHSRPQAGSGWGRSSGSQSAIRERSEADRLSSSGQSDTGEQARLESSVPLPRLFPMDGLRRL